MDILSTKAREASFREFFNTDLPTDSVADEVREKTRQDGINSLYFFSTAVCNFNKVQKNPHLELTSFIQRIPKRRKVLLIPRDCYKSTIASKSLPIWILLQKDFCGLPGLEHRILCGSFSSENAKKQIKAIRHLIERNNFLQWLYPEIIPDFTRTTWTDSNLLFPRDGVYGEDTIEAAGVDTHLVSRHYTVQIKDDLEDEKAMQSPTVRAKVLSWYRSSEALFVDEQSAYDLLVGTRWGIDDLYAQIKEHESDTYEFLCRPLHWTQEELIADQKEAEDTGKPSTYGMEPEKYAPDPKKTYFFFPTLFPADSCARIKAKQGSFMYSMLYLNNPKDPSLAEMKERDFRYFVFDSQGNIVIDREDGGKEVVIFDSLKRVLFWDPAMSGPEQKRNDRNAMVAVGRDSDDRFFVLDAHIERQNPTFLYAKFIGMHKRFEIHKAAIEAVNFQRLIKFPLYQQMMKVGHKFPIIDRTPNIDKDTRIRTLIPYIECHQIFFRRGLKEIVEEAKGFPLFPTKDGVDALAACIELQGVKVPESDRERWRRSKHNANITATRSSLTGY